MTARRVYILLVLGLLVIAFAIWLSSKRHLDHATLAGDVVLPGLQIALNSVSEVRLHKGDGTRTTLRKQASDWSVGERSYPADSGKVRKLLFDLSALNVVEEKTRTPEYYPQLGVEDVSSPKAAGTQVDAVTPTKTYSLIVGKSASGKSGYARVAGTPESLLVTPLISLDPAPQRWLEQTLIDIPQERVKEVEVSPATGPGYTASRDTKEQQDFKVSGIPKGRELSNPTAGDPIAGSLGGMTLDDVRRAPEAPQSNTPGSTPEWPHSTVPGSTPESPHSTVPGSTSAAPHGGAPGSTSAPPAEHVTFRTFDGLELALAGHKDGTRSFVTITARSNAKETQAEATTLQRRLEGWEFEIPGYKYDGLFRPLEDLLKKPPEPAPKNAKGSTKPGSTKPGAGKPGKGAGVPPPPSTGAGQQ